VVLKSYLVPLQVSNTPRAATHVAVPPWLEGYRSREQWHCEYEPWLDSSGVRNLRHSQQIGEKKWLDASGRRNFFAATIPAAEGDLGLWS
jgi:hypothetical protein